MKPSTRIRSLAFASLFLVLAGILTSCGAPSNQTSSSTTSASDSSQPNEAPLTVGMVFDSGGRGDKSFNDSAARGLDRAESELGIDGRTVDSPKVSDYEKNLEILAHQGVPLIIAVGISMKSAVDKIARKHPEVKFALVDEMVDSPNVRGLKFREEEGSFLAGYLAGLMTESKKIGFVGGMEIPLIKKFESGYIAGAKMANPGIEVLPAKYTGNWNDADLGKQTAKTLFGQGADVIYHASGGSGKGVIEAAKEENKFAIGVDSDQDELAPGLVLTSMIKRVDEAVFQTIQDFKDGGFTAGEKIYDLKSNGVGLSEMRFTKEKIGAERLAQVEKVRQSIIDGKFKVPSNPDELASFLAEVPKL